MADVKIIDIDSEQWNIKDQNARDRLDALEALGETIEWQESIPLNVQVQYVKGGYKTLPKGTWLIMYHIDVTMPNNIWVNVGLEGDVPTKPSRNGITFNDYNGGSAQVDCIVVSDGTTRIRASAYCYGTPQSNNRMLNYFAATKLKN